MDRYSRHMQYINNCELCPSSYNRAKHADLFPVLCCQCSFNFLFCSSEWEACDLGCSEVCYNEATGMSSMGWLPLRYPPVTNGFISLVLLRFTLSSSSDHRDVSANNDILILASDKRFGLAGMRKYELRQSRTLYREQGSSSSIMLTIRVLHSATLVLTD